MQIHLLFIFEKKKNTIDRDARNERKEKKKKIMENLCEIFFLFLTSINKILYFRHRSDLLSVIREDEVYSLQDLD